MATVPSATNSKSIDYEVEFELNDLGGRTRVGDRIFIAIPQDRWPVQSTLYAQDTGAFWKVVENPTGTLVAELFSDPTSVTNSLSQIDVDYGLDIDPVATSVVPTLGGRPHAILAEDGILYVICFGTGGVPSKPPRFETYDIGTDPANPVLLASIVSNPAGQNLQYDLEKVGNYVLVCMRGTAPGGGLMAYDVSSPSAPFIANNARTGGANSQAFDLAVRPDQQIVAMPFINVIFQIMFVDISALPAMSYVGTPIAGSFASVAFSAGGGHLYATDFAAGFLRTYDVTDINAPVLVNSVAMTTGIRQVRRDGNLLYVTDRTPNTCSIFSLANPAAPAFLSAFPLPCNDETQPVTPVGNLFLSGSSDTNPGALYAYDVSTNTRPRLLRRPLYSDGGVATETLFDAAISDNGEYWYASNRGGLQEIITFRVRGGLTPPRADRIPWYRLVTAADRFRPTDRNIGADATAAPFAVTLPSPGSVPGQTFTLTKLDISANAVTLNVLGAATISGAATVVLAAQWSSVTVYSTGTEYIRTASV